jgi:transposase InsO family protein
MQVVVSAAETIQAKLRFEQKCRDYGVIPQEYQTDNGSAFTSEAFTQHLATTTQGIRYAGTGAHHQNGIAELAIHQNDIAERAM